MNEALAHLQNAHVRDKNVKANNTIILQDGARKRKPDLVSVTRGPGMRSNLSCGLDTAKGLSVAWQVPLLAVHHMQSHALTPRLAWALKEGTLTPNLDRPKPEFPFLSLLVSGGHTMLLYSTSLTDHTILASTTDTAIGEALDKIGRIVLPPERMSEIKDTAFAKHLSDWAFPSPPLYDLYKLAKHRPDEIQKPSNDYGWCIQTPLANTTELKYSFSGIASRVQTLFEERQAAVEGGVSDRERLVFARTALGTAFEHLASRTIMAMQSLAKAETTLRVRTLVISGGVAANPFLRHVLQEMLRTRLMWDVELVSPPIELCTDNAAMIGWCGIEMYEAGWRSSLDCQPLRKWSMDQDSDGTSGIVGISGWTKVEKPTTVEALKEARNVRGEDQKKMKKAMGENSSK